MASIDLVDLRPAPGAHASKEFPLVHVHFKGKRADCDAREPCRQRDRQHRCSNDDIYRTVLQINLRHWRYWPERGSTPSGKHVLDRKTHFDADRRWWDWVAPVEQVPRDEGFGLWAAQPPSPRHPQKEPNGAILPLMELCFPSPRVGEVIRFIGEERASPRWRFGAESEQFHAQWEVVRVADLRGARIRPRGDRSDRQLVFVTLGVLEQDFELEEHRNERPNHEHRSCLLNCCSVGHLLGRNDLRLPDAEYAQRMPPEDDVAAAAAAFGALNVAEEDGDGGTPTHTEA
jgi:hypothetical protein